MKKISILIMLLSIFSCNSVKKSIDLKDKIVELDLIGLYEYKSIELVENHYILIDTLDNKLIGFYFGTESSDENRVSFYKAKMNNLFIEKNNIQFEIGERKLYENTQLKIIKTQSQLDREIEIGISKNILKYRGVKTENGFELKCESKFNDCRKSKMSFKKLTE